MKKKLCIILVIYFLLLSIQSSMASEFNVEDKFLIDVLEAIRQRDENAIGKFTDQRFLKNSEHPFKHIIEIWDGRTISSYSKIKESIRNANDICPEGIHYQYQVISGDDIFLIEFTLNKSSGQIKMDSFSMDFTPRPIGKLDTWRQFNILHWLVLIIKVSEIFYTIYVAWFCLKSKEKHRILWCMVILFLYGGVSISNVRDVEIGIYIYLLKLPQLLTYSGLGWELKASLPIGALMYFVITAPKYKSQASHT